MITHKKLKELLDYDPNTGLFIWLVSPRYKIKIGDIAGSNNGDGYIRIKIYGINYLAHRLAWFYMRGEWPTNLIDHENTINNDNRWGNLREASGSFNQQNRRKANTNNKTGFLGVTPHGKSFRATIGLDEKLLCLGTYSTPELAYTEYLKAKREIHPGCTI